MIDKVIDKVRAAERSRAPDAPNALSFGHWSLGFLWSLDIEHWSFNTGHFALLTPLPCGSNVRTLEKRGAIPSLCCGTKAESAARERGRPIEPAPGNAGEGNSSRRTLGYLDQLSWTARLTGSQMWTSL